MLTAHVHRTRANNDNDHRDKPIALPLAHALGVISLNYQMYVRAGSRNREITLHGLTTNRIGEEYINTQSSHY